MLTPASAGAISCRISRDWFVLAHSWNAINDAQPREQARFTHTYLFFAKISCEEVDLAVFERLTHVEYAHYRKRSFVLRAGVGAKLLSAFCRSRKKDDLDIRVPGAVRPYGDRETHSLQPRAHDPISRSFFFGSCY